MLCNECGKNEANVHMVETVNGRTTERHLCSECAAKYAPQMNRQLEEMFSPGALFRDFFEMARRQPLGSLLSMGGMMSAPEEQSAGIPVLRLEHGKVSESSAPEEQPQTAADKDRVAQLKEELAQAIAAENFEQAAVLRDRIRALESGS